MSGSPLPNSVSMLGWAPHTSSPKSWVNLSASFLTATGPERASELLFTGDTINGTEAVRRGLASYAVDADQVEQTTLNLARRIAAQSPAAVRTMTVTLRNQVDAGLDAALSREAEAQASCYAAPDLREGLAAVVGKRSPQFKDLPPRVA
mmetsp:Transcript_64822/g.153244  ORF Transcript_64822/g.153244 Transcript_64822/m.153244 type:complete len:149 (-) Transcript_64822:69-515(-)